MELTKEKIILTDADGVLLDWLSAFQTWMQSHGYQLTESANETYHIFQMFHDVSESDAKQLIKQFNESAAIGFLPAFRDSVWYVRKLHEKHGYQFRVITSLSRDPHAQQLREKNLRAHFGDAIEQVICLGTGDDKDQALLPYKDTGMWWCEDKPENAAVGHSLGLSSILMEHGHNAHHEHQCPYSYVKNWKSIYQLIVKQ